MSNIKDNVYQAMKDNQEKENWKSWLNGVLGKDQKRAGKMSGRRGQR
jgi:hypothetical protein